ncbi:MAG: FAD/FMN-containing dehydrogenase [Myxococcota bacterium]
MAEIVRQVAGSDERLRVVGAGHSWSDAVLTDGHLMSLDGLAEIVETDAERGMARVQGGARLKDMLEAFAAAGLAFENLGSIAEQSIAGAISTGTHGSSRRYGNLATQVTALRFVDGRGQVHAWSAETHSDAFRTAVLSLGCLGVITEVTLRCRPAFDLHERTWSIPFEDAARDLVSLSESAEFIKLWWLPHTDRVQIYAADTVVDTGVDTGADAGADTPRSGPGPVAKWMDARVMPHVFTAVLGLGRMAPALMPGLNRIVAGAYFKTSERVDRSDHVLMTLMPPKHREAEYAIDVSDAGAAFTELRDRIVSEKLRVNFLQELRFVAKDALPLSPDHGRDTCRFGIYSGQSSHCDRYFRLAEDMLLARGGRPHWGKEFFTEPAALRAMYPELSQVAKLRQQFDPKGVFRNAFVNRLFDE